MFHSYKFRYEFLNKEFLPARAAIGVKRVNIYISLDDFYHRIHKPYTDLEFQTTGGAVSKQMVSNLMNLIAHYKNWAAKEGMQPVIFLIYTTSRTFKNTVRIPTYREHFLKIMDPANPEFFNINQAINNGYTILQVLTKYVHNAYAIDSSYLEPSIVPLFLSREYPADMHILVSRDEFDFQYVCFNRWTVILPRGDASTVVNKGNLWTRIQEANSIKEEYRFHPDLFVWAKSGLGDRFRGIPKLTRTGWKTLLKYLSSVSNNDQSEDMLALQLDKFRDFVESKKIQDTNFNHNFYCTSVRQQVDAMMDYDKNIIKHQITDMEDINALQELNRTIFRDSPIELNKLLREAPAISPRYVTHDDYVWRKLLTAKSEAEKEKRERESASKDEEKIDYEDIYTIDTM